MAPAVLLQLRWPTDYCWFIGYMYCNVRVWKEKTTLTRPTPWENLMIASTCPHTHFQALTWTLYLSICIYMFLSLPFCIVCNVHVCKQKIFISLGLILILNFLIASLMVWLGLRTKYHLVRVRKKRCLNPEIPVLANVNSAAHVTTSSPWYALGRHISNSSL